MKMFTDLRLLLVVCAAMFTGCAVTPYDYTALNEAKPRSIVVIAPNNQTVEVNAPYIYMSTLSQPLAEKGYYVYPVAVVENFMKENGLPTPAEMNAVPLDKIREIIGADAVLYTDITDWGQKYSVLSSESVVAISLRLVDTRTGKTLWHSDARAVKPMNNSGGGLIGALVSAAVTQVAGSIVDHTPEVARIANTHAFDQPQRGLLNGPYVAKSAK